MIYVQELNTTNLAEYSEQMKRAFNLLHVKKSVWIKTKNPTP